MTQDLGPEDTTIEETEQPAEEDDRRRRSTVWSLLAVVILMLVVFWLIWQYLGGVSSGPGDGSKSTSSEIPVTLDGAGGLPPDASEADTAAVDEERPSVPDVVGMGRAEAITAIRAAGYFAVVTDVYGTTHPSNTVIQQNPTGGTALDQGEDVGLLVQVQPSAKPTVVVPRLEGLSQAAAEREISELGCTAVLSYRPGRSGVGNVYSQWPAAGARVDRGGDIQIQITIKP